MWGKMLEGGIALLVISFVLFICSSIMINYNIDIYGISFKTIEIFRAMSAFSISISFGIIAMAIFACYCLLEE